MDDCGLHDGCQEAECEDTEHHVEYREVGLGRRLVLNGLGCCDGEMGLVLSFRILLYTELGEVLHSKEAVEAAFQATFGLNRVRRCYKRIWLEGKTNTMRVIEFVTFALSEMGICCTMCITYDYERAVHMPRDLISNSRRRQGGNLGSCLSLFYSHG